MRFVAPIVLGLACVGASCWGWVSLIVWAPNDKRLALVALLGGIGGALACGIWLSFQLSRAAAQRQVATGWPQGPGDRATQRPHGP